MVDRVEVRCYGCHKDVNVAAVLGAPCCPVCGFDAGGHGWCGPAGVDPLKELSKLTQQFEQSPPAQASAPSDLSLEMLRRVVEALKPWVGEHRPTQADLAAQKAAERLSAKHQRCVDLEAQRDGEQVLHKQALGLISAFFETIQMEVEDDRVVAYSSKNEWEALTDLYCAFKARGGKL